MNPQKVKSSIYVAQNLFDRVSALKRASGLSFNTITVLALEEYLQQKDRQRLVRETMEQDKTT